MTGLLDGTYVAETWATVGGRRRTKRRLTVRDGKLSVSLPAFSRDLAVKVKFLGERTPSVQSTAGWTPAKKPANE